MARKALCTKPDGSPIRILQIGHHFCIRCVKICRAFKSKGYKLDALTNRISYGTHEYERVFFYHTWEQFRNVLGDIKDWYDIIEVHNEPDALMVQANAIDAKPLIHHVHDLDAVRMGGSPPDETRAFQIADAVVFVSEPVKKVALDLHKYDGPTVVLEHYCNENQVNYTTEDDAVRSGIVYEGGANPPNREPTPFIYRDLHHLAKKIVEMGNELHMYIGNMDGYQTYHDTGAFIYPPTHYDQLMEAMVKRKWGACIFNNENLTEAQTNLTTMNKAYEYITAGLPVIFLGAPEQARLFKPLGISIELKKMEDLGNVEEKFGHLYPQLKANVDKARKTLVMERHIHKLERLYNQVLGK